MNRTRHSTPTLVCASLVGLAALATSANAQWSHNPSANFGLSTGGSDQNQAKTLATADGGCYIVWLDGIGTGWDTRLQRVNAKGMKQLGDNGVMVADTAFSSTQDYGFAIDATGNAIIAYRDDNNSGAPVQIKVQKVDPSGSLVWGAGVQVSLTAGGSAPHCCGTSDGGAVVAWTTAAGAAALQKVDAKGAPQWTAGGVIDTQPAGIYFVSDVVTDNAGGAIVLYHHQTGGFSSPRHVKMQRFDSVTGAKLWNSGNPVVVFDGGSLATGYFPYLVSDGNGGALVSWHNAANAGTHNSHLQHVDVNGAEIFAHNGVTVADDIANRMRIWTAIALDASTGDIYMIAKEGNINPQGSYNLRAQKFDSTGARQWGSLGIELIPQGANQPTFAWVQALSGGGAMFCWDNGGFNAQKVFASRLDAAGASVWKPAIIEASSVLSGKARLWETANASGDSVFLTWADNRTASTNDIFSQCINLNGSLGNPGDVDDNGVVNAADLLSVINNWGACSSFCPTDLAPAPMGDGNDNASDLLQVINNWG